MNVSYLASVADAIPRFRLFAMNASVACCIVTLGCSATGPGTMSTGPAAGCSQLPATSHFAATVFASSQAVHPVFFRLNLRASVPDA